MSRWGRDHVAVPARDGQKKQGRTSRLPLVPSSRPRRLSALAVTVMTMSGLLVGTIAAPAAQAYPGPIADRSGSVVTADALPTVQVNGVVWAQAIVGNTVFAGGEFTAARPAGAAPGTNTTPRTNILAYNLTTGALITSITTSTKGGVRAITASPDGSRVYIGGDFTEVNGVAKNRIAAISATTGQLITGFTASASSQVKAIAATNDRVYFGGLFTSAGGSGRNRVAAVQASNGALTGWNPNADYTVNAIVVSPDGSRVIVGGAFQNIGGAANYGLAAVNTTTGASVPFDVNQTIRNAGKNSAILGLTTDGSNVFGNGYTFGTGGNFEGTFSATPAGALNWLEDCHGDTYANYSGGPVVYTVSHAHYCGNIGGFGQSEPSPWALQMRRSLAFTKNATGTANHDPHGYPDWFGKPTPSLVSWFPELAAGSYTGQGQAAWTITGNSQYIVLGGEFPTVNGVGQQGLVRFATGTSKNGPRVTGAKFMPTLNSFSAGTMHVGFQANWDRDDMALNYRIVRDSTVTVWSGTVSSTYWNRPFIDFTDTVAAGSHRYRLYVTDPAGNQVAGDTATGTVSASGASLSNYAKTVKSQGAGLYWRLGESSGSTAIDWSGASPGVAGSGITRGAAGAIVGDANTGSTFNGSSTAHFAGQTVASSPAVFSASIWFKASSGSAGELFGYGNQQTANSTIFDRHIYLDDNGRLNFGLAPKTKVTITSSASYRDNQWHQAIATLGSTGMRLYVDGAQVAVRSDVTSGEDIWGYWRVGGDMIGAGWTNDPGNDYFKGSLDEFSVYPTALTAAQVSAQWAASGRGNAFAALAADAAAQDGTAPQDGAAAQDSTAPQDGTAAQDGAAARGGPAPAVAAPDGAAPDAAAPDAAAPKLAAPKVAPPVTGDPAAPTTGSTTTQPLAPPTVQSTSTTPATAADQVTAGAGTAGSTGTTDPPVATAR